MNMSTLSTEPGIEVRAATARDLGFLVQSVEFFFKESGYAKLGAVFDPQSTHETISNIITAKTSGTCLIVAMGELRMGFILSVFYRLWFDQSHLSSHELAWWVYPMFRAQGIGRTLYEAYEVVLRRNGVNSSAMIALEGLNPTSISKFYELQGYDLSEHLYHKNVT